MQAYLKAISRSPLAVRRGVRHAVSTVQHSDLAQAILVGLLFWLLFGPILIGLLVL